MDIAKLCRSHSWKFSSKYAIVNLLFLLAVALSARSDSAPIYKVSDRWSLTGDGGWSYVVYDAAHHTILVPRDNRLTVLDTRTGKTVGEVAGLTDVRDVALDPDGRTGYISDGVSGVIRIFDRASMHVTLSINVGGTLDAIVFEPGTRSIFAFNTHNKSVAVIEKSSYRIMATIPLPGRPASAIADQRGSVFVNLVSDGTLARIDAKTAAIATVWQLAPCVGPTGMAMDATRSRVFSVCENKIMVVSDTTSGKVVASVPVGEGAKSVAFDPDRNAVFSANGNGSLTVIREDATHSFNVSQTLETQPGARTMVLDSTDGRVYLVAARFGQRAGPTSEELQYRPSPVPGSAVILVISSQ